MVIGKYYETFYANNLDNLDEIDKSLERHKLPKLMQEEKNLNVPLTSKEI